MKKLNFLKLISLIFVCALIIGTVAVTALAAEDQQGTVEIVAKNIYFGDNYKLQFAIDAPEDVDVSATCNGAEIEIERAGEVTLGGVVYPIYQTVSGWAPQNINAVVTVTATAGDKTDILCYSVLMYLYERLNLDGLDPEKDADRIELYETLLAHAKAADKVVNSEENGRTPNELGKYHYVSIVGGTLDGYNDWGMFKEGDTPLANLAHNLELAPDEEAKWSYSIDGIEKGEATLDELKALKVEGATVVTAVAGKAGHVCTGVAASPIKTAEELALAAATDGTYYLANDIVLEATVDVTANVNICLNGKKISRVGEEVFAMISVKEEATLTLTDCGNVDRVGYIDPVTKLWVEGEYTGEETVTVITLNGGLITNGAGVGGRAIYSYGTLNTYGINFAGNFSSSAGGAVCTSGIYNDEGSVFVGNTSSDQAGAIQVHGNTTLNGTKFLYNASTANRAGALLATGSSSTLTANGCNFEGNTAKSHGGAVVLTGHKLATFDGCNFINNESGSRAGALYGTSNSNTVTISCLFEGNRGVNGGAISTATSGVYTDGVEGQTDKGSIFKNNTASQEGGAIHLFGPASLYGTKAEGNTAEENGGAIYMSNSTTLDGVELVSNTAVNGGACYVAAGTTTAKSCTFDSNTATASGGAVYVVENATYVDGEAEGNKPVSTYNANTAVNGGAMYIAAVKDSEKNPDHVAGKANVYNATFTGNVVTTSGGAIYAAGGTELVTVDCTFSSNECSTSGGAVYVSGGNATITGGSMNENVNHGTKSSTYAGALYANSKAQVTVTGTVFYKNKGYSGGAIASYSSGTKVTLNDVELDSNGGANGVIYVGGAGSVEINNLNAHDNATTGTGAIFYVTSSSASTVTVNSATLSGNTVKGKLGFIHLNNAANVLNINKANVTGSDVQDNWDALITGSGQVVELPIVEETPGEDTPVEE